MNMQTRFIALKKFSALVGIAGASVLISSFPAWSQSAPTSGTSGEASTQVAQDSTSGTGSQIELSPEGLEILCERFPLNSRCTGSAGSTGTSGTSGSGGLTPRSTPGSLDSNPPADGGLTTPGTEVTPPGSTYPGDTTPSGGMTPPYTRPDSGVTGPGVTPPGQSDGTTGPGSLTPPPSTRPGSGTSSPNTPSSGSGSGSSSPRGLAPKSQLKQDTSGASTSTPSSTQPSASEASTPSTTSETTPGNSEATQAEISDAELQRFANVIPKLQEVERSAQQQLSRAIADAGISQQRFSELYSAQQAPSAGQPAATANAATPEERESFNQVLSQIQTINQQVQSQKVNILQSEGLQPQQFNRILAAVQQDPELQQQVQQLINN